MPSLFELYCTSRQLLGMCEQQLMAACDPNLTLSLTVARGELAYWSAEYEVAAWPHAHADLLWIRLFLAHQLALEALDALEQRKAA